MLPNSDCRSSSKNESKMESQARALDPGGRRVRGVLVDVLSLGDRVARDIEPAAPDLRAIVIDGAGHFVAEERPGLFVEHVLPFLSA